MTVFFSVWKSGAARFFGQIIDLKSSAGLLWQTVTSGRTSMIVKTQSFWTLAFFGLCPLLIIISGSNTLDTGEQFLMLGLYYSCFWGMLFFKTFRPKEVTSKTASLVFGASALWSVMTVYAMTAAFGLDAITHYTGSSSLVVRTLSYVLGVGFPEELAKLSIILYAVYWMRDQFREVQSYLVLGLLAGLGFGINEGIAYQTGLNRYFDLESYYLLNVLRLTSLPFLHAVWCATGSLMFFLSKRDRAHSAQWLSLAIIIPGTLHGVYNAGANSAFGFFIACLSVTNLFFIYRALGGLSENEYKSETIESPYASFGQRIGARWIDSILVGMTVLLLNKATTEILIKVVTKTDLTVDSALQMQKWINVSAFLALYIGYFVVLQKVWQCTLGKKLMSLQLSGSDGAALSYKKLALRELVYSTYTWTLGIGLLSMLGDAKKRAAHDFVGHTEVLNLRFSGTSANLTNLPRPTKKIAVKEPAHSKKAA